MRHVITHHFPRTQAQSQYFALTRAFNETVVRNNLGWEFYADEKRRAPNLNILREKSAIVHEVLDGIPGGDEVLWIDGDVLLVGDRIGDIFNQLGENDFGMCRIDGRLNSGVIPMKVNPTTRELWKEILYHERQDSKPVINELIRQDVHDLLLDADLLGSAPGVSDSYKVKLIELPSMWNECKTITADTQIIGYHGYDAYSKLRLIQKELEARQWQRS